MSEINRSPEVGGLANSRYQAIVKELARKFVSDEEGEDCLIFLGAGVANDSLKKHLPIGSQLGEELAKECHLEWHEYVPLSTVAFYYEFFYGREALNRFLRDRIADATIEPSSTTEGLMDVIAILEGLRKDVLVVTTNYDQHFERAYKKAFGREPNVVVYNGGMDAKDDTLTLHSGPPRNWTTWRPRSGTCLYKMHGCISQAKGNNLVIAEEDYVNFLSNALSDHPNKRLPLYLLGRISDSSTLFIGYSLSDWNFRVIFKATAEKVAKSENYAVQYFNTATTREVDQLRWAALGEFWAQNPKNIRIINADASLFISDLSSALHQIVPAGAHP
jgi:hypothetical protein